MATQYDPIAKDESLNTTETPSRNIADVLAEELEGIKNAIGGGGGSGGHTIYDADEQAMPQRAGLGFLDAHVSDNSGDDRTDVSIIEGISKTDWDNLDPTDPSNNGLYEIEMPNNTPILDDTQVAHGNSTVNTALNDLSSDSGWVQLSAVDGNKMMYRKIGKVVYVAKHTVGTIAANTAVRVGTLPSGCRPLVAFFSGASTQYIQINTDGKIYVRTATADYMESWYVSFIADA